MLNREVGVYRDPGTGEIFQQWRNPFLDRDVTVIHRFNDHVNVELMVRGRFNIGMVPMTIITDDIWWRLDKFFLRPSPISRKDYPLNVQHDLYQGAELTMYTRAWPDHSMIDIGDCPFLLKKSTLFAMIH